VGGAISLAPDDAARGQHEAYEKQLADYEKKRGKPKKV
jgi:hypothetical protein